MLYFAYTCKERGRIPLEEKREQTSILAKLRTNEKKLENDIQNKETDDSLKGKQIIQDELLNQNTYSLLSPKRKENQEAQQNDYISPLSEEFIAQTERREDEYEEEKSQEGAIPAARIQAFITLAVTLYAIALIVGYYNTPYSDGVPQVVTEAQIDERKYISEVNEYLTYIQTAHVETMEAIENYTADLMSAAELSSQMKKSTDELEKKVKEVEDVDVPSEYESLHNGLKEMYAYQISINSAAINYASHKTEETFNVVNNINTKYENRSDDVIEIFNESF